MVPKQCCAAGWCFALMLVASGTELLPAGEREDLFAALKNAEKLAAQADYPAAAAQYEWALARAPRVFGADSTNMAVLLNNMANLYCQMSQYAKAEPLALRGLQIREARLGPDHIEVAGSLNNLATLYKDRGQLAQAETMYLRGLKIKEARLGTDHPDVAGTLSNLAGLYSDMGQYAQAEPLYQRSLKIREARLGPQHLDVASSLNNLATLYYTLGQYAKAEPLYQRSLQIKEARLGPDHPSVAFTINNLAVLYKALGQYAKAEPLYQRSLQTKEARLGADHPDVADSLINLANLYSDTNEHAKAEPLYQRSLKIYEANLGPEHSSVANSLLNLATLYGEMGQAAQAEPLYLRSLKIKQAALGPDHPDVATAHNNLAWNYEKLGQTDKAAGECDRMRRIVRRHVAEVLPVLGEREQLAFIERRDESQFHCALSFGRRHHDQPALAEQSAGWLFSGKAVVQASLAERALLARDSANPALAEHIKRLLALRSDLASLSLAVPKPGQETEHRRKLAELSGQEQELTRQVHQATGRPAKTNPWIEPDAVRAALAADAVLIDIARFRPFNFAAKGGEAYWQPARYVAWVVPPAGQGNVEIVDLGPAEEIDAAVQAVRKALEGAAAMIVDEGDEAAEKQLKKPLDELAKRVLQLLTPHLGQCRQLIISPDAALWLAPWGALPLADGRYAIEQYQLRYLVSSRDLLAPPSASGQAAQPIIMADPNFDLGPKETQAATQAVLRSAAPVGQRPRSAAATSSAASSLAKVARLPGTSEEAKAITPELQAYAGGAPLVYTDQWALEGVFKAIRRPKALVLSTHGFFLPDQEVEPDARPLAFSDSRGTAIAADGQPVENPLLRCGLLLTGCNQGSLAMAAGGEDGVLSGMEIVGTDLRGTELVVLSACETGLGQVRNGEGVAGLRQAFQLAGAQAVVSTLWQIPDRESARLMTDFFSNLAAGQTKANALRAAQLAAIKQRRAEHGAAHPFYWAAYTLTGG